jgi:hypothetical protein
LCESAEYHVHAVFEHAYDHEMERK